MRLTGGGPDPTPAMTCIFGGHGLGEGAAGCPMAETIGALHCPAGQGGPNTRIIPPSASGAETEKPCEERSRRNATITSPQKTQMVDLSVSLTLVKLAPDGFANQDKGTAPLHVGDLYLQRYWINFYQERAQGFFFLNLLTQKQFSEFEQQSKAIDINSTCA